MAKIVGDTGLNDESLLGFLSELGWPESDGALISARRLKGGVSNVTALLTCGAERLVVKQARPKLDVSMDWEADVRRLRVEAAAMSLLHEELGGDSIPSMIGYDAKAGLMAMEAAADDDPNWKDELLAGRLDLETVAEFGELLGRIHSIAADRVRAHLPGETFFDALRLDPYYTTAAGRQDEAIRSKLLELVDATRQRAICLVHGDYSPKNVLLRKGRLLLLDYEVCHIGDPGFDLGFALTHFVGKALHVAEMRSAFIHAARIFRRSYAEATRLEATQYGSADRHLAGCMLGRVDGKSPLEYLQKAARATMRNTAQDALAGDMTVEEILAEIERT
jgi:aminoglycoside phosphotransferase (APT) family kinase protein